jgi:hypothetical protein
MNQLSSNNAEVLEKYVRAALEQWEYTRSLLRDKAEQSEGIKILYSVDTDIVKLFTNPVTMAAPRQGRDYGYLQIFPDDDPAECIARGRIVAEHIFRNLHPPLLVVPPLTEELAKQYDEVASQAHDEQFRAQHQLRRLKSELEGARKSNDREELLRIIQKKAPELVRLIEGDDDATAELRRFSTLFRDQLVASPHVFVARRTLDPSILAALLPSERTLSIDLDLNGYREKWTNVLQKPGRARATASDVQALAHIQRINTLLPKDVKLVHITGDSHIFKAGYEIFDDEGVTFTERFLRHPRSFLAEPGILSVNKLLNSSSSELRSPASSNDFSEFSEWLIVFLANFWKRNYNEISDLIRLVGSYKTLSQETPAIQEFCRDSPEVVTKFRARWGDFSRDLTLEHTKKMIESMPYLKGVSAFLKSSFDDIQTQISDYVDESWRSSFQVATATSYGITRISTDHASVTPRGRSVPLISFDSFTNTTSAVKQIIQADSFVDLGDKQFAKLFRTIEGDDKSGYLYYLVYATLFSAEGRWSLARILAERSFASRHKSRNLLISGREAAYFCAVAIRNSARNVEELDLAEQWISVAEECLKVDVARRRKLKVNELRFRVELASIKLARKFFDIFARTPDASRLASMSADLGTLQREFETLLVRIQTRERKQTTADKHEIWINKTLKRRVLVNIVMIALIRKFYCSFESTGAEQERLLNNYLLLSSTIQAEDNSSITHNYLYNAIWLLSTIWLSEHTDEVVEQARELLSNENIEKYKVMPYDRQRLRFFRELIETLS